MISDPHQGLRHRLKRAAGVSWSSSEYTLKYHVPEIIRSGAYCPYGFVALANSVVVSDYDPGYGKVAAFEDSDPCLLIYRKFGWLHKRILLHLQDELVELEEQLQGLDEWETLTGNPKKLLCRRLDDAAPDSLRRSLLKESSEKLGKYGT